MPFVLKSVGFRLLKLSYNRQEISLNKTLPVHANLDKFKIYRNYIRIINYEFLSVATRLDLQLQYSDMAKDSYGAISEYFGIPSVKQLITNRDDIIFLNRCQENYV